jgi:hypothetical protein
MNLDSLRSIYRLVATHTTNKVGRGVWNVFFIGSFAILGGFSGTGVVSAAAGIFAGDYLMNQKLADRIFFGEALGGIAGLILGLIISSVVVRGEAKITYSTNEKLIGAGQHWMIFAGIIWPCFAALACAFEPLLHIFGDNVGPYVALGIMMVILATIMILYDRVPKRFIIPIGIIGWMLTFILAIGLVFWTCSGILKMWR